MGEYDCFGGPKGEYDTIKRMLWRFCTLGSFQSDIEETGIPYEDFRSFALGMKHPTLEQAKIIAKKFRMPLIEYHYTPEDQRLSAIDTATGESIRIEEV